MGSQWNCFVPGKMFRMCTHKMFLIWAKKRKLSLIITLFIILSGTMEANKTRMVSIGHRCLRYMRWDTKMSVV